MQKLVILLLLQKPELLSLLFMFLLLNLFDKINAIPISSLIFRIILKFINSSEFSKSPWANNQKTSQHQKAKPLNVMWKLNLCPKLQIFEEKLVCSSLSIRCR